VHFLTLDGCYILPCERIFHRTNLPFIIRVNQEIDYAVNFNETFEIAEHATEKNRESEEAYFEVAHGVGIPRETSLLLANFVNKIHSLQDKEKGPIPRDKLLANVYKTLLYNRSIESVTDKTLMSLSELEGQIEQRQ